MIAAIAWRELKSMFLSPLAWVLLAVVQLILAWMFLRNLDQYMMLQSRLLGLENPPGVTEVVVAPLLGNAGIVMLLLVPMITMRLITEERRSGSLALLFSAPLSMTEIVLGKYLGTLYFLGIVLGLTALMPLSLLAGGSLDAGLLAAGLLGLALLLACYAAVGLFMSTLTRYPAVAAIATFGALLLSWIMNWTGGADSQAGSTLAYLSLLNHYEPFLKGVFDSADAVFLVLVALVFLVLSVRRLDADRLGG
jgi:ABC-2 type transport system permease protein